MATMADCIVAEADVFADVRDFERWMRTEQGRIFVLCFRFLRNRDEADSATQDVFLKAYRALQRPDPDSVEDPAKWLTRIAVHACLDRLRSRRWLFWQRRLRQEDEQAILDTTPSSGPDPEDAMFAKQVAQRLARALDKLSLKQRSVFVLKHYEDRSLEEIAEMLAVDVGTVKAHMFRAVRKLRRELRDLYGRQALER